MGFRGVLLAVEELLARRAEISDARLVFEHTDTYRGRGDLRPLVRHLVESWGGRLAGSTAAAAHIADDKIEAQRRLRDAGLRVPRSRIIARAKDLDGVEQPAILKRPFEHGSRGVARVESAGRLRALWHRWQANGDAAILAEEIVEGRELAASVLEIAGRPRVLPLVEVRLENKRMYSRRVKWAKSPLPIEAAWLEPGVTRRVEADVLRAFQVLGLEDYARFDIRLLADGTPCFLEANARPSVEPGTELRLSAKLAGMRFEELVARIIDNAARRHGDADLARKARAARRALR